MEQNGLLILTLLIMGMAQAGMMVYIWYLDQKRGKQIRDFSLDERGKKGWDILHSAIKKSEAILSEAELSGIEATAETRMQAEKMEKKLQEQIGVTAEEVQKAFLDSLARATEEYKKYLESLKKDSAEEQKQWFKQSEERGNSVLSNFEKTMASQIETLGKQTLASSEAEVAAVKKAVEDYRVRRLSQIDADINSIVEETVSAVVGKGLTLSKQAELISEALEKAKAEKFI